MRISDWGSDVCLPLSFLEPILERDDTVAEFRTVDDHFAIGIVEDVEDLLGDIAVIDVHMDQAPLEAGCHQLAVFGSVAHIKGNLGPIAGSALPKRAGDIVRTSGHFGPGNDPVTVDQGWRIPWQDRQSVG